MTAPTRFGRPDPAGANAFSLTPSPSQREAIEATAEPILVLAGPGAGKTYCLIERIRYLVNHDFIPPERICVFTFTNKAAGEIATRLERELGPGAGRIKRGTIHAFCADLLREYGAQVGLEAGFGIADEDYQLFALRRIEGPRRWHRNTLTRFAAHRFCGEPLLHNDAVLFARYEEFLESRRLLDFDHLVLKAAELLESPSAPEIWRKWDAVLVDEFQDLNPVQYRIVRYLARHHRHVFAVGDDEQSIYSWAGADPAVFRDYRDDFQIRQIFHLQDNRRCPREVFALARKLVMINTPIFENRVAPLATRVSDFPILAYDFESDNDELRWISEDIRRDRAEHKYDWGEIALLYRKHEIGEGLEGAFLNAGIPCRLANGRALSEDPVIGYVLAALRVIAQPGDDVCRDQFFATVMPKSLFDLSRAQAEAARHDLRRHLNHMLGRLPRADEGARQIRRALRAWRNLEAIGRRHTSLESLIQELLSQRVGRRASILDECQDEISDPASHPDVEQLSERLRKARERNALIWFPHLGGAEIALKGMLGSIGFTSFQRGGAPPPDSECIFPDETPSLGIALGLFKAAQLLEIGEPGAAFADFTAVDIETTDNDTTRAEIVEIAAVRVRAGQVVEHFNALVRPRVPITAAAAEVHKIRESEVAVAPYFEDIWPKFRAFCGDDVIVAHNGYEFDFLVMKRMVKKMGKRYDLLEFDSIPLARELYPTSRKLTELARKFGIDTGQSHRALDDARTLAKVFVKLNEAKQSVARKTALVSALDHLGVALAASDESTLGAEAQLFRKLSRGFSLGRYSDCLEFYEREQAGDETVFTVDELIERLGGAQLMVRIRSEKTADERYPAAMLRLRRVIAETAPGPIEVQVSAFLERAVLSKWDGSEAKSGRVNLLTLHSTKGLEFSRVYIVGAEDSELPGGSPTTGPVVKEVEEARRLLYVGMTRTKDRLVLTRVRNRKGKPTGGHQFLDEMGLSPQPPS